MFVYRQALNMLELKEGKDTEYVTGRKSKGTYNSKITPLNVLAWHKTFGIKTGIRLNKNDLL